MAVLTKYPEPIPRPVVVPHERLDANLPAQTPQSIMNLYELRQTYSRPSCTARKTG